MEQSRALNAVETIVGIHKVAVESRGEQQHNASEERNKMMTGCIGGGTIGGRGWTTRGLNADSAPFNEAWLR
jgi:hypothetical protein